MRKNGEMHSCDCIQIHVRPFVRVKQILNNAKIVVDTKIKMDYYDNENATKLN